jgi:YegS/Rv2252/BmrU family lipid kinase
MRVLPAVEAFAARYAADVCVATPSHGERIEALASELASSVDQIIVVGGDGTLNGVVNGVLTSGSPETAVTFLPAGRGKDAARTLPSLSHTDLERTTVAWAYRQVDVGHVSAEQGEGTFFINIGSLGLGATAARIAARLPRLPGTTCYLLGAAGGLLREQAVDVRLTIDDEPEITMPECRLVAAANGRYFGGGLHIAPMAVPDDGLLDVVTVSGAGRVEILRNIPRVFRGTHMSHPAIRHWRARTIAIEADHVIGVETDGEVLGHTPARITVQPAALRWAVPQ